MKPRPLVLAIALSSIAFAMLLPPEAYPNGKMAVILSATFAFLAAISEHRISSSYLKLGFGIFAMLLAHTLLFSVDLYRSLDTLSLLWAYYCIVGFFMHVMPGYEKTVAGTIVALTLIVAGYGIYQYFWGFDKIYQYIFYAASDTVVKAPALDRVASRRVFSTLALPGTLWGFLVCALPFHAALWRQRRWLDVVLVISALLVLATGFLTRSFGFLLGLFVLAISAGWLRNRRLLLNRITPLIVVLVITAGLFYSARRGAIEGADPVGLRFKNWVSAWNIFASNPLGIGLNTFGIVYPEYMQPGANETQFVHNTFLQLLAELGYPLLLAAVALVIWKASRIRIERSETNLAAMLALPVWIVHNLVDIDVYFGSVGVLGAVIIGMLLCKPRAESSAISKPAFAATAVFAVAIMAFAGGAFISSELQNRAQIEFDNKKLVVASETLESARRICPINSSLDHDLGEMLLTLYHQTHDPKFIDRSYEAFRTEVRLSPKKAGAHIGYSLALSTLNRVPEAIAEIHVAQRLYPSSAYIQSIAQLLEQRIQ